MMWERGEMKEQFEQFESKAQHEAQSEFSQADRVNLNTRIKTMILSKQQVEESADEKKAEQQNATGHFLWYSHHHRFA